MMHTSIALRSVLVVVSSYRWSDGRRKDSTEGVPTSQCVIMIGIAINITREWGAGMISPPY